MVKRYHLLCLHTFIALVQSGVITTPGVRERSCKFAGAGKCQQRRETPRSFEWLELVCLSSGLDYWTFASITRHEPLSALHPFTVSSSKMPDCGWYIALSVPWMATGRKSFANKPSCPVTAGCFFNAASTALTVVIEIRVNFMGRLRERSFGRGSLC